MARDPIKDVQQTLFACPHCGQRGKVAWQGRSADRAYVSLSEGFISKKADYPVRRA